MSDGNALLIPFLNDDPVFCFGVEFGMQVMAPMFRKKKRIKGYFRTENEEQIRLACYRMGYNLVKCDPWEFEGEYTGWVFMAMELRKQVPA